MFHSDDSEARRRYLQTMSALTLLEIPDNLPKSLLVRAARYARDAEAQIDRVSNCAYGWAVAGDLLLLVLNAAVLAPEHASLRERFASGRRTRRTVELLKAAKSRPAPALLKRRGLASSPSHICAPRGEFTMTEP